MAQDNNTNSNTGCLIAVGIFVLASIIYYFATTSKSDIAESGAYLTSILFFVGAYFGIKAYLAHTKDSDSKIVRIGVPIGIFIVVMFVLGLTIKDFNTMVGIGSIFFIIFCIVIGILIYNLHKE